MCALAFVDLLGTFLEPPRSMKLPGNESSLALFGREGALSFKGQAHKSSSLTVPFTPIKSTCVLVFLNLPGPFLKRPRSRKLPGNDLVMIESRVMESRLMTLQGRVSARFRTFLVLSSNAPDRRKFR